jgi:acyl-CoA synthetase (AMP-forming)/AMP-acid ligase II
MPGWNYAAVWDGIAEIVRERDAVVCGERRITWAEFARRATRLARHLEQHADLRTGDKVGIDLTNRNEYLETFFAALKLGCVPVNVNFRYRGEELHYLLENSDARALVYDEDFATVVDDAVERGLAMTRPYLLTAGPAYERAIDDTDVPPGWPARPPDGDDLIFLYTGGTTGLPKGVMWRNDDLYRALWAQSHPRKPEVPDPWVAAQAGKRAATTLPAAPLMHGTGLFASLSTLAGSGTVVLVDRPGLDVLEIWDAVERERVGILTIVGDVFARPLLDALDAEPARWDLSSLRVITSSGVMFSPAVKKALLAHLPGVTIVDSLGASEGLGPRSSATVDDDIAPARFVVNDRVRVLDEDTDEDVVPGSGASGMLAMGGNIPMGYYKDPEKTAATFRTVDGRRYSIPGDYATVDVDGTVQLLGRGSACINTGGEKVYPDEVEAELRKHPSVLDCVVVGVPDVRFGEKVVAVVELADSATLDDDGLREWCRERLAGYKAPRAFLRVESMGRAASGKAHLTHLRALAAEQLGDPSTAGAHD